MTSTSAHPSLCSGRLPRRAFLWHSHSWLCSWVSLSASPSSRPEWPVFSSAPHFGAPATERRDRGNQSTFSPITNGRNSASPVRCYLLPDRRVLHPACPERSRRAIFRVRVFSSLRFLCALSVSALSFSFLPFNLQLSTSNSFALAASFTSHQSPITSHL
jgi:hypothetical protein